MGKLKRVWISIIVFAMLVSCISPTALHTEAAAKVKLNTTKVTLTVGATKQLKVTGTKKKVTWSSSKKRVATVSKKGKVTAKKAGTATITAKVGKRKLTCKVTVKNQVKDQKTITLTDKKDYASAEIMAGGTLQLKVSTAKKVTWKSSNKKVAVVSKKGKVTTKKGGYVTITAKAGRKCYTCDILVTVDEQIQLNVDSITLYTELYTCDDAEWLSKYEGHNTATLKAAYASGKTPDSGFLVWHTDYDYDETGTAEEVVCVDQNGKVEARCYYGTATVYVEDLLSGTVASCKVTVTSKMDEDIYARGMEIISEVITEGMTDAEKVLAIHDWMCYNVSYGGCKTVGGPYAVLIDGQGTCGNYAMGFNYLMNLLEIPCVTVHSDQRNHAWNQVQINGKWYWIDVQLDDSGYSKKDSKGVFYEGFLNVGYRNKDESRTVYRNMRYQNDSTDKGITYTEQYNTEAAYKIARGINYNPHVQGIILPD